MTNLERDKRQLLEKIEGKNINAELLEALKAVLSYQPRIPTSVQEQADQAIVKAEGR